MNRINKKNVDIQTLAEAAVCALFGLFLFKLTFTDAFLSYLTPRMKPWLFFTALVMLLWAFSAVKSAFAGQHSLAPTASAVILIPFILLLLPRSQIDINSLSYAPGIGRASVQSSPAQSTIKNNPFITVPAQTLTQSDEAASHADSEAAHKRASFLAGYDEKNKTIAIDNEEFLQWVDLIYKYPFEFEDYRITVTGMMFHDPQFMGEQEFIPARLLMVCCAADLIPYGLVCRYNGVDTLEKGEWLSVTGKIVVGEYHGNPEAQVQVESITKAQPFDAYVYPQM